MNNLPVPVWICPACGYKQNSDENPVECPICKASKDQLILLTDSPLQPDIPVIVWRCRECGFIHYGSEPPEFCPVCGFPANQFEPLKNRKRSF